MSAAYNVYMHGNVLSADPLTLICIVYDAAVRSVQTAHAALLSGDAIQRTKSISKASEAIGMLSTSLRLDDEANIGRNLLDLYLYLQKRLLDANLKKDGAALVEVEELLRTLRAAWAELAYGEAPSARAGQASEEVSPLPV